MTSTQVMDTFENPSTVEESEESEDESENKVLETGGEGRWQKNNQQVSQNGFFFSYFFFYKSDLWLHVGT